MIYEFKFVIGKKNRKIKNEFMIYEFKFVIGKKNRKTKQNL